MFVVEGSKLTNKERLFLRTVEGINFLLSQYKNNYLALNNSTNLSSIHYNINNEYIYSCRLS